MLTTLTDTSTLTSINLSPRYQGDINDKEGSISKRAGKASARAKGVDRRGSGKKLCVHNSEIVRSVRERMEREQAAASLAKAKERAIAAAAAE